MQEHDENKCKAFHERIMKQYFSSDKTRLQSILHVNKGSMQRVTLGRTAQSSATIGAMIPFVTKERKEKKKGKIDAVRAARDSV